MSRSITPLTPLSHAIIHALTPLTHTQNLGQGTRALPAHLCTHLVCRSTWSSPTHSSAEMHTLLSLLILSLATVSGLHLSRGALLRGTGIASLAANFPFTAHALNSEPLDNEIVAGQVCVQAQSNQRWPWRSIPAFLSRASHWSSSQACHEMRM